MQKYYCVKSAILKMMPTPPSIHAAPILERTIDESGFFCFNVGFSYNVGNHINATQSSIKAAADIMAVDVNRCFELILKSSSLKRITVYPIGIDNI